MKIQTTFTDGGFASLPLGVDAFDFSPASDGLQMEGVEIGLTDPGADGIFYPCGLPVKEEEDTGIFYPCGLPAQDDPGAEIDFVF